MEKKKILIADDEKEIRDILQLLLQAEGYETAAAEDGGQALAMADETVDMYILDVNMPKVSGYEAAREIRSRFSAPILFLTAYSGEADKVMGFSVGADDYLVKPFSNLELLMRIRAIFRRIQGTPSQAKSSKTIRIQDVELNLETQCAYKNGQLISLTWTEYKILELLASHPKKIYSLDNIYQSVWQEDAVGDGTIMVHIKNLRKKLGDDSRSPRYIKTAWGKGYYVD